VSQQRDFARRIPSVEILAMLNPSFGQKYFLSPQLVVRGHCFFRGQLVPLTSSERPVFGSAAHCEAHVQVQLFPSSGGTGIRLQSNLGNEPDFIDLQKIVGRAGGMNERVNGCRPTGSA